MPLPGELPQRSSRSTLLTQAACSGHSTVSGWLVVARWSVTRAGRSGAMKTVATRARAVAERDVVGELMR